jgi:hypothetical protein
VLNSIDFRSLGKHMPRRRIERGYVYKVGKTTKMWEGRYHLYDPGRQREAPRAHQGTGAVR